MLCFLILLFGSIWAHWFMCSTHWDSGGIDSGSLVSIWYSFGLISFHLAFMGLIVIHALIRELFSVQVSFGAHWDFLEPNGTRCDSMELSELKLRTLSTPAGGKLRSPSAAWINFQNIKIQNIISSLCL